MKIITFTLTIITILLFAMSAMAHPLGNFSVNQFARIEVNPSEMKIRQVLDLAEIPTIAELRNVDINSDGTYSEEELNAYAVAISPQYLTNIEVNVNGQSTQLSVVKATGELRAGAGDLSILRIVSPMFRPVAAGLPSIPMGRSPRLYSTEAVGNPSPSRASASIPSKG